MKIIIRESQLKRLMNEIGGYDDAELMGQHAGEIQSKLLIIFTETTNILANSFIGDIYGKLLSIRNVYSDVLPSEKLSNRTAYQDDIFLRYLGLRKDKFVKIARQIINNSFLNKLRCKKLY